MTQPITAEDAVQRGLSPDEYTHLLATLGRTPSRAELGVFSAMWNEHCSYKSSRVHLKKLPTTGEQVIHGPGENAGVVHIGDNQAVAFKMESHNHPSYIEPYQGAATGVGGILRDVFTMGARPIACLNALRFGEPNHPKTRHLLRRVVAGIGGYGNSFGVPTVGGETNFHACFNGNILVNAMAAGLLDADKIFTAKPSAAGCPVVYVGAPTGRDGINGASMASAGFVSDDDSDRRPTVQTGDPFVGRRLLEASLALMHAGVVIAVQDMGAAGLTCSVAEIAGNGNLGITVNLDLVPTRAENMTAEDMLLSETQERMLFVLNPQREAEAVALLRQYGLSVATIGHTDDNGRMKVWRHGVQEVDLPVNILTDAAPLYERPYTAPVLAQPLTDAPVAPDTVLQALQKLLGSANGCSKAPLFHQYDNLVRGQTVQPSGGDAGVVQVHQNGKGLAFTVDVTPRYCVANPYLGAVQAVAESCRNLSAVGATPLALTDNLNFGSPRDPAVMGSFVASIDGLRDACLALNVPIVSGNVSLYNDTDGAAIHPVPAIGAVGLLANVQHTARARFAAAEPNILLLGAQGVGHLGASAYLRDVCGREDGTPPAVDLADEAAVNALVRQLIGQQLCRTAHDISDGGLLVAVAECAIAGNIGASIALPNHVAAHAAAFGEDQGRYIIAVSDEALPQVQAAAAAAHVPCTPLGTVGGDVLTVAQHDSISLIQLQHCHATPLAAYLDGETPWA